MEVAIKLGTFDKFTIVYSATMQCGKVKLSGVMIMRIGLMIKRSWDTGSKNETHVDSKSP